MVKLSLSSPKGNSGSRYFPTSGYLGLTPVRVEGFVRTNLEDDQKPLLAKSLTVSVRCYECRTRVANNFTNILVEHTQVLWSKPDTVEYESIGNVDFPFQLSIPASTPGFSSAIYVDYRCIWRLEAVLTHIPISGVGSRQVKHSDLILVRYDTPSCFPSPLAPEPILDLQTSKPRSPTIKYSVHPPRTPIGPMDLVSIPLHLKPLDKAVSIRSASVIVERRITLIDNPSPTVPNNPYALCTNSSNSSLHKPPSIPHLSPERSSSSTSLFTLPSDQAQIPSLYSSTSTITPEPSSSSSPLLQPPSTPTNQSSTKSIVNIITDAHSSGNFTRDQNGVFTKTLTLQWPSQKSRAHWAIGETVTSDIVSIKFFLRTKIVVISSSGSDTIELADKELCIVSTNQTERQLAAAKYSEQLDSLAIRSATVRSKSKSPRRSKIVEEVVVDDLASEDSNKLPNSGRNLLDQSRTAAASLATPTWGGKGNRRPHTSAGPRDKPMDFSYVVTAPGKESEPVGPKQSKRHSETIMRNVLNRFDDFENYGFMNKCHTKKGGSGAAAGSASGKSGLGSPSTSMRNILRNTSTSSSCSASSSGNSSATSFGRSSDSLSQAAEELREWEEELARIEARSKESSVLFAIEKRRKKDNTSPSKVPVTSEELSPV